MRDTDDRHLHVTSTSRTTAVCSDILLKQKSTTRLVFRPMIVDNKHDQNAAVKGWFIHQRKGPKDTWDDYDTVPLSSLKKGEGYKLELKSGDLLKLFNELKALYRLHAAEGVPQGDLEYFRLAEGVQGLADLGLVEFNAFLKAHSEVGSDLLVRLLAWAAEQKSTDSLLSGLDELSENGLGKLSIATSIGRLTQALKLWHNAMDRDEEFWQQALTEHSFVLEQVYSWPVTVVRGKAWVSGRSALGHGGGVVDFLVKNALTDSAALVEIKSPATPLTGREYRAGVWAPSQDLSGAVVQILSYKDRLLKDYYQLSRGQRRLFEAFEPSCAVIIGQLSSLNGESERSSFELFRAQASTVSIVTYDELIEKTERVIGVMSQAADESQEDDDVPF